VGEQVHAGSARRLFLQARDSLVRQRLESRPQRLDVVAQKSLIDQAAQASMIRRIAQQHVRRQRLERSRQPADDGAHPAIAGRRRALHETVVIAQQIIDGFIGRGQPDRAEDRKTHPDDRPQRTQRSEGRERVFLERPRAQVDIVNRHSAVAAHARRLWSVARTFRSARKARTESI